MLYQDITVYVMLGHVSSGFVRLDQVKSVYGRLG
jgi:hypothetical protein